LITLPTLPNPVFRQPGERALEGVFVIEKNLKKVVINLAFRLPILLVFRTFMT